MISFDWVVFYDLICITGGIIIGALLMPHRRYSDRYDRGYGRRYDHY